MSAPDREGFMAEAIKVWETMSDDQIIASTTDEGRASVALIIERVLQQKCASCGRSAGNHKHYPNICDGFKGSQS
jgi:hypothetical protein